MTKEIWEEIVNLVMEHDDRCDLGRIYFVKNGLNKLGIEWRDEWEELVLDIDICGDE